MSDDTTRRLERMLLWFESTLPPHDLTLWRLELQPVSRTVEDTTGALIGIEGIYVAVVRGFGQCARCRRRFDVPQLGNFGVLHDTPNDVAKAVERAKIWVRRDAERAGPCWGDVPNPPDGSRFVAVLDEDES